MKGHDLTTPNHCCTPHLAATLLAVAVQTVAAPAVAAPQADLTAAEMAGYQRWLYSLDGNGNWLLRTEISDPALALRNGIAAGDSARVDTLLAQFSRRCAGLTDVERYWYAFALADRQRWAASLEQLRRLLIIEGLPRSLGATERAWVLTAAADHFFLLDAKRQARDLYSLLSISDRPGLRLWGEYQLANIDFLDTDYRRAATTYEQLCDAPEVGRWQAQACAMAEVARQMNRIKVEGGPYGTATYYHQ